MSGGGECAVIVRYDDEQTAECRSTYEYDADYRAVLVVTFGPTVPTGNSGYTMLAHQLRGCVAPRVELDGGAER